jgi:hypothetical protein
LSSLFGFISGSVPAGRPIKSLFTVCLDELAARQ